MNKVVFINIVYKKCNYIKKMYIKITGIKVKLILVFCVDLDIVCSVIRLFKRAFLIEF